MQYIIDRIEEDVAVCETPEQTQIRLPLSSLPDGAKEGDVLTGEDEAFFIDTEATDARRKQIRKKMQNLFQ